MNIYRPGPQGLNGKIRLWPRFSYLFRSARNGWSPFCLIACFHFFPFITPYSILKVVWAPDHILISKERIDSILPPAGFSYDTMPDYVSVGPIRVSHVFKLHTHPYQKNNLIGRFYKVSPFQPRPISNWFSTPARYDFARQNENSFSSIILLLNTPAPRQVYEYLTTWTWHRRDGQDGFCEGFWAKLGNTAQSIPSHNKESDLPWMRIMIL